MYTKITKEFSKEFSKDYKLRIAYLLNLLKSFLLVTKEAECIYLFGMPH